MKSILANIPNHVCEEIMGNLRKIPVSELKAHRKNTLESLTLSKLKEDKLEAKANQVFLELVNRVLNETHGLDY